jgi:hypothetical protein
MGWFSNATPFKWYRGRSWLGRIAVRVGIVLLFGWAVTGVVLLLLLKFDVTNRHEIVVGALLAWTGELIFFSILGGTISLVTLKDPAQASFDERIRILFGTDRLPDSVMTYNKRMLSRLAGYAEIGEREVVLEEYNEDFKAYRARIETTYQYKNLLPDVDYNETLPWYYIPDVIKADKPIELARILSIKIDGTDSLEEPILVDENGFRTELRLKMPRKGQSRVVFTYMSWIAVGNEQTMNPSRLVEQFKMTIVNLCTRKPAPMNLEGKKDPILLLYGKNYDFEPVQSVAPGEKIFSFSLLSPQ